MALFPIVAATAGDLRRPAEFVPDLEAQFAALSVRADPLGLNIGTTPNPSSCKHYQAIVRLQGQDGTPYLVMTRSGNTPPIGLVPDDWACDDSPRETGHGNLVIFRMDSREKHGERMRSNRLHKGVHVDDTLPDARDVAVRFYTTTERGLVERDGTTEAPATRVYGHPGGMQAVGSILAVALETPYDSNSPESMVLFLDMSNPESPRLTSTYAPTDGLGNGISAAGTLGITRMPDGHFLMAITGGSNNPVLHFFRSSLADLASPQLAWSHVDEWFANVNRELLPGVCELAVPGSTVVPGSNYCLSPDEQYLGQNWPDGKQYFTHQTLQFLRDGDINGTLYLAGARGRFMAADTSIDLYRVDCTTPNCVAGEIRLRHLSARDLAPYPLSGGDKLASFAAATGFYTSPSGELLLYGAEHDNDGPGGTVKAGEWRNRSVVRENSPTLRPTASIDAPASIDEGSQATVRGAAAAPLTKAFLQLFHGTSFGSFGVVADFADRDLDDFGALEIHELQLLAGPSASVFQHSDKARSWIWHAPSGCSVQAVDRDGSSFVRARTLTESAAAVPAVRSAPDLAAVSSDDGSGDMDRNINAVRFLADCEHYYAAPFQLNWDVDGDGAFDDGSSTSVVLSAAALDGPSVTTVRARSQSTTGGATGESLATIVVNNVAPRLTSFDVRDGTGMRIGVDVPFALLGLPLEVTATFVDPGKPDRQTASLDWGDGIVESSAAFEEFSDAHGGRLGTLASNHRYALAGEYAISVIVTDDDGGIGRVDGFVSVLSPADALQELIEMLGERIAVTTEPAARRSLELARLHLLGAREGMAGNGAVEKLSTDQRTAASQKIRIAIAHLEDAAAAGCNVTAEASLLKQLLAVLSIA
jgi:hypothetical protein